MTALTIPPLKIDRAAIVRGIAGGGVWGMFVASALLGISFYQCGSICVGQIVETTTLAVASGVVAIGPLAAFKRRNGACSP
jgi:hypothetical protein